MKYSIQNSFITLVVDDYACEMHSLKRNDFDYEYLWQGLPQFWKGRNPTLFPLIGSSENNKYLLKNKYYEMGNHGFVRSSIFKLIDSGNDYLLFELNDNEDTIKCYPYKFRLQIKYSIESYKVKISYKIINDDDYIMPFCFGVHPAFNINLHSETKVNLPNDETITIEDSIFENTGTIVFEHLKSSSARLLTDNKEVELTFGGFPKLAIWKPLKAPFVCIEPWFSNSLSISNIKSEDFENWQETIKLEPKHSWTANYCIEIIK